ncbi:MAG: acyltransferase, partial [Aquificae bacterium]|nr:acyltransferase [Aquificota bacterium]
SDKEYLLTADLNLQQVEKTRQVWPFFRDRRNDTYQPITKLWLER